MAINRNVIWDDKGLKAIFEALDPKNQEKMYTDALKISGKAVRDAVKLEAKSMGYTKTGLVTKNGWTWLRTGRLYNAISVGKVWAKGSRAGTRIFNRTGKKYGYLKRAPHAHLVIGGHRKVIPAKGAMISVGTQPPQPMYSKVIGQATTIWNRSMESAVEKLVKRLNRKYS